MNCSEFEGRLAELLAGPGDPEEAQRLLEHARRCPGCAGAAALVEVGALPGGDRDPVLDPGEAYWAGFDARLAARRRRAGRGRAAWIAAAAGILLVLAVAWALRPGAPGAAVEIAEGPPPRPPAAVEPSAGGRPEEVVDEEARLLAAGVDSDDDLAGAGDGFLPSLEGADPHALERLERWLDAVEGKGSEGGPA